MIPKNTLIEDAKNELYKIKEIEKMVDRENLVYKTNKYTYSFKNFITISNFGRDIYNGTFTLKKSDENQGRLLVKVVNFKKKIKPQNPEKKREEKDILKNLYTLFDGRGGFFRLFKAKYFQ